MLISSLVTFIIVLYYLLKVNEIFDVLFLKRSHRTCGKRLTKEGVNGIIIRLNICIFPCETLISANI